MQGLRDGRFVVIARVLERIARIAIGVSLRGVRRGLKPGILSFFAGTTKSRALPEQHSTESVSECAAPFE
jgi:hypothetical protein